MSEAFRTTLNLITADARGYLASALQYPVPARGADYRRTLHTRLRRVERETELSRDFYTQIQDIYQIWMILRTRMTGS